MGTWRQTEVRRKKREVAVAPRSGAHAYRLTAWLLAVVSLGLLALTHYGVRLHPGDKMVPLLCATLLYLAPVIGSVAGVVGLLLSRSPAGRIMSLVPLLLMVPLWLWLMWELIN